MEAFLGQIMDSYGYLGIGLLILIENVFPPIPSEFILTMGGLMTTRSSLTVLGVIISATIGSLLGAIVLYLIGKILNKDRLIKIVESKYGRLLRVKRKDIEMADKWFLEKGTGTVFFCRFIPIVRSLISIPAGMSEMSMIKFIIYTLFGSAIWNTVLVYVGAFAGNQIDNILNILDNVSHIILILLIVIFVVCAFLFYKSRLKKKANSEDENTDINE